MMEPSVLNQSNIFFTLKNKNTLSTFKTNISNVSTSPNLQSKNNTGISCATANCEIHESNVHCYVLPGIAIAVIFIGFGTFVALRRYLQNAETARDDNNQADLEEVVSAESTENINSEPGISTSLIRRLEFPMDRLKFSNPAKLLGRGAFGYVFQADAIGIIRDSPVTIVAVKTIPPGSGSKAVQCLISELKILNYLGTHLNVIKLLGACTTNYAETGELFLILEYCRRGNLRRYLLNNRHNFSLNEEMVVSYNPRAVGSEITIGWLGSRRDRSTNTSQTDTFDTKQLLCWAFQVSSGMKYLVSKKVLHGDLAARNVLLTDTNIIKICDFGFSKILNQDYCYRYKKCLKNARLPYKWMALESLTCGIFSTHSDCWSFGILLWELFSLGISPYAGKEVETFIDLLKQGYRLGKPEHAPLVVHNIMLQCWQEDPEERPSFEDLSNKFEKLIGNEFREYYIHLQLCLEVSANRRGSNCTEYLFDVDQLDIPCSDSTPAEDSEGYLLLVNDSASEPDV